MEKERISLLIEVTDVLIKFGFSAHLKGYHFIREAIIMVIHNTDLIDGITKLLYPEIAKKYSTTSSRVERGIRHSIEIAYEKGNQNEFEKYFCSSKERPTNSEFIATIADKLNLEMQKAELNR